jgi:hypothetical protein
MSMVRSMIMVLVLVMSAVLLFPNRVSGECCYWTGEVFYGDWLTWGNVPCPQDDIVCDIQTRHGWCVNVECLPSPAECNPLSLIPPPHPRWLVVYTRRGGAYTCSTQNTFIATHWLEWKNLGNCSGPGNCFTNNASTAYQVVDRVDCDDL